MGEALPLARRSADPATDARRMADNVMRYSPATDAEALKLLRASYPHYPLSLRVAALDLLMRQGRRGHGSVRR
ncbi:MAG: transferase [Proteobacteria bacterium]|nr:transferase [Pseudomonadota bacterium]